MRSESAYDIFLVIHNSSDYLSLVKSCSTLLISNTVFKKSISELAKYFFTIPTLEKIEKQLSKGQASADQMKEQLELVESTVKKFIHDIGAEMLLQWQKV